MNLKEQIEYMEGQIKICQRRIEWGWADYCELEKDKAILESLRKLEAMEEK